MPTLYTLESLVFYAFVSVLLIRTYEHKPSILNLLFVLLYIPLYLCASQMDLQLFMLTYPVHFVINTILLKVAYRKAKIATIIYTQILLFCLNAILTSLLVVFIPMNIYYLEASSLFFVLILCIIAVFSKINISIKQTIRCTPKVLKLLVLWLLILLMIINTLLYAGRNERNDNWLRLTQGFTFVMVLSIFILLPLIINYAVKNQQLKQLTDNYQQQIEAQAKHYAAVAQNNWEIRRFQHDAKNLQVGLSQLLEQGNAQEAQKMLQNYYELSQGSKDDTLKFDTGNGIVDALLADKQQTAQAINTTIVFEGAVPSGGITPTDLCVLFGNTLDNAIDACEKFPLDTPKTIEVVSKWLGGYLMVNIKNPVVKKVAIHKNTIPTTKEDEGVHGFGLYSLEQVVKKHNGALLLQCENNIFEISIDLTLNGW